MSIIFDKIQTESVAKQKNRFITNVKSIENFDDIKEYLIYVQDYLEKVEERIKKLEIK